jgi:hypothetical protein
VAKNNSKAKKPKEAKLPTQAWLSMRGGLIVMAITSLGLAILIAYQTIPSVGWLEGILWGLLFGGMIWVIFFGNLWITRRLRK